MPLGPIVNCVATFVGAVVGTFLGEKVPERLRINMPIIFGLLSFALGIPMVVRMENSLPVVLAVLLGTIIGECICLEDKVEALSYKLKAPIEKIVKTQDDIEPIGTFMNQFIGVLVLFSASGMGIFGALNEGMTGDSSLLLTKSLLDFCTAIIFSTSLGIMVAVAVIPQAIVLFSLFFLATVIMPVTTPEMLANFSAVGGIIMLANGLRITGIREFPVVNMLPSLFFIMPFVAWMT